MPLDLNSLWPLLDNLTAEDRSLITHPDITNAELSKNDLEKTT